MKVLRPGAIFVLACGSVGWVLVLLAQWSLGLIWQDVPLPVQKLKISSGFAVSAKYPAQSQASEWIAGRSTVFEDGKPLRQAVPRIAEVSELGAGRYRVKPGVVWFSASDNSSPLENHRAYILRIPWLPSASTWIRSGFFAGMMILACGLLPRERQRALQAFRSLGGILLRACRSLRSRSSPPAAPTSPKIACLTSFRFLAAALVVFQHSEMAQFLAVLPMAKHFIQPLMGSAVSCFFVLSGFILQYNYPVLATKTDRYNFLCARVARLWPCHLLFALVFLCFAPSSGGLSLASPSAERTVLNLLMLQSWVPVLQTYFSLNGVSWSISTEFFFYVVFMFLAGCSPWRFRLTLGFSLLFVLVAAGFCSTAGIPNYSDAPPDQVNYHGIMCIFPMTRLAEFLIGMGMCRFRALILAGTRAAARNIRRDTLVELIAILLVLLWMSCAGSALEFLGQNVPPPLNTYLGCAHGAAVLALLIMVFSLQRGWLSSVLGWRLFVFLGEISFSLYLCHQLVHEWLASRGWFIHPFVLNQAGYWCLILLISSMSFLLVERPLRRLLAGFLHISPSDSALAASRRSTAASTGL